MADKFKVKYDNKNKKLVPHLMDKKNYCIHYRNLKYVKELGLVIEKVHNVIRFDQSTWLKEYIDFNTEKRKEAKNEFEKDFFKLVNNSVFGKTMENLRNRISLHMTVDEKNAIKWFSNVNFKTAKHFDNLYLIESFKKEIIYDKPLYVGTSILDISKIHMMAFHYGVIDSQFKHLYKLVYSDTDSFVYQIFTEDIYDWISKNRQHFDLSESEINKDATNEKALGFFKDELKGSPLVNFTSLNPKSYCYNYLKEGVNIEKKKAKGVSKVVLKKEITNADYKNVLETGEGLSRYVCGFHSYNHDVFTTKSLKQCLTPLTDKSYAMDWNDLLPYGHYKTKQKLN